MEFQKWNSVYQQLNNSNLNLKLKVIVEMIMAIGQSDTKYFFYLHFSEKKTSKNNKSCTVFCEQTVDSAFVQFNCGNANFKNILKKIKSNIKKLLPNKTWIQ